MLKIGVHCSGRWASTNKNRSSLILNCFVFSVMELSKPILRILLLTLDSGSVPDLVREQYKLQMNDRDDAK